MTTTTTTVDLNSYLKDIGGMIIEENDKCIKFLVASQEDFDGVVGCSFLLGLNIGAPRDSSVIPGWMLGRVYKNGEPVDEEEEKKF